MRCVIDYVIVNGVLRLGELTDEPAQSFTSGQVYKIFLSNFDCLTAALFSDTGVQLLVFGMLLRLVLELEEQISSDFEEETMRIAEPASFSNCMNVSS